VIADSRAKKEGRIVEQVGSYNQVNEPPTLKINEEKVLRWLKTGATPSQSVREILKRAGIWKKHLESKSAKVGAS
jgi:small subunit ribosomal protein S16